jgi:hypothetical protein
MRRAIDPDAATVAVIRFATWRRIVAETALVAVSAFPTWRCIDPVTTTVAVIVFSITLSEVRLAVTATDEAVIALLTCLRTEAVTALVAVIAFPTWRCIDPVTTTDVAVIVFRTTLSAVRLAVTMTAEAVIVLLTCLPTEAVTATAAATIVLLTCRAIVPVAATAVAVTALFTWRTIDPVTTTDVAVIDSGVVEPPDPDVSSSTIAFDQRPVSDETQVTAVPVNPESIRAYSPPIVGVEYPVSPLAVHPPGGVCARPVPDPTPCNADRHAFPVSAEPENVEVGTALAPLFPADCFAAVAPVFVIPDTLHTWTIAPVLVLLVWNVTVVGVAAQSAFAMKMATPPLLLSFDC